MGSKAKRNSAPSFAALDVETANPSRDGFCQIGIVHVRDGRIEDEDDWTTLVDPETWFADVNVEIHRIAKEDVQGKPVMPRLEPELRRRLSGYVVSHSTFDGVAFERAFRTVRVTGPVLCLDRQPASRAAGLAGDRV